MATVKVKLRPSSVKDKAGTIYYRIIHTRRTQYITTTLHVFQEEWDAENGTLLPIAAKRPTSFFRFFDGNQSEYVEVIVMLITQTKGINKEWSVDRILVLQMGSSLCKRKSKVFVYK